VEPLFLSGQGNSIPELQRGISSDGRAGSMDLTLAAAIAASRSAADRPPDRARAWDVEPVATDAAAAGGLPRRALDLFDQAERRLREGDWAGFGEAWRTLRRLLEQAAERPTGG